MIIGQNRRITAMQDLIDLNLYLLDQPESVPWQALVTTCQENLAQDGLFNLSGFVPRDSLGPVVAALPPGAGPTAFTYARAHFRPPLTQSIWLSVESVRQSRGLQLFGSKTAFAWAAVASELA